MNGLVRVKICGIRTLADALGAVNSGADALGFVFAPSPRRITPEQAREIILALPPFVTKVGVFVNEARERVEQIADNCGLDVLQFHGDETPVYCKSFKHQVIKAFRVKDRHSLENLQEYQVNGYLLDTYVAGVRGGTGTTFNWYYAREVSQDYPVILAGGLNPDNIVAAIQTVRPYAVDISSGVETDGRKDIKKIVELMRKVRSIAE